MNNVEKTVFISYRRTNSFMALAVYQDLTKHGFDVFFDYNSIDSGDFEQIILGNIKSRAHFLLILTPSALERCEEPKDWLRREIETALDEKRNIVPLMFEGFDYSSPSIGKYLTGKLAMLKNFNAQRVPADFFDEAMAKVRTRFLNVPLEMVIYPRSTSAQAAADKAQSQANKESTVTEKTLTAQEWFEKGYKHGEAKEYDAAISAYTETIRLKPDYAEAYNNRGNAHYNKQDYDRAISDYTRSIELKNPELHLPYTNRGKAHYHKQNYDGAISDYSQAIRLKPDYADAYLNRGNARDNNKDYDGAIADYNEAIRLKADFAEAYYNRGVVRDDKKDYDGAIADYSQAIRLKADFANAYVGRGAAYYNGKRDYRAAKADWEKALQLNPNLSIARDNLELLKGKL